LAGGRLQQGRQAHEFYTPDGLFVAGDNPQASPHFSGMLSNKRIKKAENLSEKNRNAPIDGEDRHERPERVEY
jgi:hypothetical protein